MQDTMCSNFCSATEEGDAYCDVGVVSEVSGGFAVVQVGKVFNAIRAVIRSHVRHSQRFACIQDNFTISYILSMRVLLVNFFKAFFKNRCSTFPKQCIGNSCP
jgi:hypothetical protein